MARRAGPSEHERDAFMSDTTVAENGDTYEARERARLACIGLERQALREGEHEGSLRHAIAQVACLGRNVKQSEGSELDDMVAERALLRFAAFTTKAVGIALASEKMVEDDHDVELEGYEASAILIGLSELLVAAPKLIHALHYADIDIRSNGESEVRS